jgi:hypothetical protein
MESESSSDESQRSGAEEAPAAAAAPSPGEGGAAAAAALKFKPLPEWARGTDITRDKRFYEVEEECTDGKEDGGEKRFVSRPRVYMHEELVDKHGAPLPRHRRYEHLYHVEEGKGALCLATNCEKKGGRFLSVYSTDKTTQKLVFKVSACFPSLPCNIPTPTSHPE